MNIYQIVPTLSWGDAIGNEVLAMDSLIRQMGHETCIYVDSTNVNDVKVQSIKNINPDIEDIVIFHLSIGTYIDTIFKELKCRKIIVYHNMTSPCFFENCSKKMVRTLTEGLQHVVWLQDSCDLVLADSEYNKQQLTEMGYDKDKVQVLPIILDFNQFNEPCDKSILTKYKDDYVNILFTGRIAPNKKHEDLIRSFYYYKKEYNSKARLILAGSYNGMEKYYAKLKGFVKLLELDDVIFTGHIPVEQLLSYYRVADIFLCMSEHEGFCVPLLESMHFQIPIVAYNSTAIPYTLDGSGVLVDEKDYPNIAKKIDKVIKDNQYRTKLVENQNTALKQYSQERTELLFKNYINKFIEDYCK